MIICLPDIARPTAPRRAPASALACAALVALAGCDPRSAGVGAAAAPRPAATANVPTASPGPRSRSARRPRASRPTSRRWRLRGGATTRDELVAGFVRAVEGADTLTLRRAAVSRAEFAFLFHLRSAAGAPPREAPGAVWERRQAGSAAGLRRLREHRLGRPLGFRAYECDPEPTDEGRNRYWTGCVVHRAAPGGGVSAARLFGAIVERDGRFKFVSYENDR
jgi:hypothetical protein